MIYDCFTFFNELDLLEIRFNVLDKHVDFFVLCEAPFTFSQKPKPLFYQENAKRFKKWHKKIIYFNPPPLPKIPLTSFDVAGFQKDSIRIALRKCKEDDTIYYGDVDEIWKPQEKEGKLRQLAYSYYLNQRSSEDWQGTNMFKYKNIRSLNDIRADHSVVLEDGGWHFTNMGGEEQILKKLDAYDHQEANTPFVRQNIKYRMEQGQDFLGRSHDWKGNEFKMWLDDSQLPEYVVKHKDKWIKKGLWKS